jgi:uncharacterized protein YjbJ (UPF0337 family)
MELDRRTARTRVRVSCQDDIESEGVTDVGTSRARDKVGGAVQYVKGRFKERWGVRTNNPRREAAGGMDQIKGGARNKKGHAKDLVK